MYSRDEVDEVMLMSTIAWSPRNLNHLVIPAHLHSLLGLVVVGAGSSEDTHSITATNTGYEARLQGYTNNEADGLDWWLGRH